MPKRAVSRAKFHDYSSPSLYMLTLMKDDTAPTFGYVSGDWKKNYNQEGHCYIAYSSTGMHIKNCIYNFFKIHPYIRLLQYVIMPDHLHLLVHVTTRLPMPLGNYIAAFKVDTNKSSPTGPLLAPGFNDQIIMKSRKLDVVYSYIRDNPRRLAVRLARPGLFSRIHDINIDGSLYHAYGNIQLLQNPFSEQVIVHRADSVETVMRNRERWLYVAENGGVLVSPFISQKEREIFNIAKDNGGKLILITNKRFKDREKPAGQLFDLCVQGRLLILTPTEMNSETLTRDACLEMNRRASRIAQWQQTRQPASPDSGT